MPEKVDLYDYHRFHKSIPHPSNYPVISNVQVVVAGANASITWTTDVASTSQVDYGTNPFRDFRTPYDPTLTTSHLVFIPNLNPFTYYYFDVRSFNIDALSISDMYVFLTGTNIPTGQIVIENGIGFILLEDGTKLILEQP